MKFRFISAGGFVDAAIGNSLSGPMPFKMRENIGNPFVHFFRIEMRFDGRTARSKHIHAYPSFN